MHLSSYRSIEPIVTFAKMTLARKKEKKEKKKDEQRKQLLLDYLEIYIGCGGNVSKQLAQGCYPME